MKKHLLSICCMALTIGLVMASCTKGDPVYLDPEVTKATVELSSASSGVNINSEKTQASATIGYGGGEFEITIAATPEQWSHVVTDEADRFTVTKTKNVLKISAPENKSPDDSYAMSITVTTGKDDNKATAVINVIQSSATPAIHYTINNEEGVSVDEETNTLTIDLSHGAKFFENIVISSNFGDWVYNEDIEEIDWIEFGKDLPWMLLQVAENMGFEDRSATFTLTIGEGEQAEIITVNVTQKKVAASIAIIAASGGTTIAEGGKSATNDNVSSFGDTFTFTVSSNGIWEFILDNPDPKVNKGSISGNTFTYTILPTDKKDAKRTLSVTVRSGIEGNYGEATISITQRSFNEDNNVADLKPMIIEVTTTTANQKVYLPLYDKINCDITWGDGSAAEHFGQYNPSISAGTAANHTYETPGTYTVSISGVVAALDNQLTGIVTGTSTNSVITKVVEWGYTELTSMRRAFLNCTGLKSLPEDDEYDAFKKVIDFEYAFRGATALVSVSKNAFKSAATEVNCAFGFLFQGCTSLESIDGELFANATKIASITNVFDGCSALESIPEELFENVNVTSFASIFAGCKALKSIPENLFENSTSATNFSSAFGGCSALETIPAGLFANNTGAINFSSVFNGCSALETIPAGLFGNNTAATNFSSVFNGCSLLEEIPANLFASNVNAMDFSYAFTNCEALESVPEDLFATNIKVTTFANAFQNCTGLEEIPATLFEKNTSVMSFMNTFSGCLALKNVPESLFEKNDKVTTFSYTFNDCKALEEIPADLFATNVAATTFSYTFQNCIGLTEVPEGLFEKNINASNFGNLFAGCSELVTIPPSIFDTNKKVGSFQATFSGCSKWVGEAPYYSGTNVHIYERTVGDAGGTTTVPYGMMDCFKGCTNLSDYTSIPSNWGGGKQ